MVLIFINYYMNYDKAKNEDVTISIIFLGWITSSRFFAQVEKKETDKNFMGLNKTYISVWLFRRKGNQQTL